MGKKPNILLILTDDQRAGTIGALGCREIHTPNLDALVRGGTSFVRAHIPGGTSGAVCMPSRAMLHTGRTLFHLEAEGQAIPESHTLLGEHLQSAGYQAFGTGKWHNGKRAYARSFSCGDNIFFGGMADHWNVPACRFDPSGTYAPHPVVADPMRSNALIWRDGDRIEAGVHSSDLFADTAVRFLEERDAARPFFLYVSLLAPHDPRTMPDRFLNLYDPADIELPPNWMPGHPFDNGALKTRDELLAGFPRDPVETRRHIAEYYGMISHLDDACGRVVAALRASGELDNTIIVFAGDNGLALGQHGLMGKQNLYDHSIRVPLVFSGPGIPADVQCETPAYLLDIFPTLCELAGLERPASVEGASLCPCLCNPGERTRDWLYLAYRDKVRGVTDGRRKLIEYAGGQTQVFDLSSDPYEMDNLAETGDARPMLRELRSELLRLSKEWDDRRNPFGQVFWAERNDLGAE